MTTAIIHGDPGSRKTATLVSEYGVPALYEGRVVVTNIRGFTSLEKVEQVYRKSLPETAELISVPFTESGFEEMARFFHWAPPGALILMDEGQRVYPTRLKNLSEFDCEPARETGFKDDTTGESEIIRTVESAFDCHRHMNWDIYISTPNIGKIHKEIRQVAEFGYRQKDLSAILPALAILLGDFKRVKHDAEKSGKSQSDALQMSNHRIDKRAFQCYQSTATGAVKGSHTKASILHSPKLVLVLLVFGFGLYHFGSTFFRYGSLFPSTGQIAAANSEQSGRPATESALAVQSAPALPSKAAVSARPAATDRTALNVEHYGVTLENVAVEIFNQLHSWNGQLITTNKAQFLFTLFDGEHYTNISSADLTDLGFTFFARYNLVIVVYSGHAKALYAHRYEQYDQSYTYQDTQPAIDQQTSSDALQVSM